VTPGYLNRPDLTEAAFDEEGFYMLGDAAKFVDPYEPAKGLVFDGRVTEDFKLSSGTWVSVGTLRADVIAALSPAVQDCVIAGLDKEYVAVLAWPNMQAMREICADANLVTPDEILRSVQVTEFVRERLARHNRNAAGSSTRVLRIMLMSEPPSIDGPEITDKGYVNQRATLDRRAALVDALFAKEPSQDVILV
jgi:feruloyl-CoA synthase